MPEYRIIDIRLDEESMARRNPEVEQERAVAIYDLLESNYFKPTGGHAGPFIVYLKIENLNRLVLDIRGDEEEAVMRLSLPLMSMRRLIRDYFQICDSYYAAIKHLSPSKIETIDMARRGLHDEGARVFAGLLDSRLSMDFDTARRFFTLVCVLHVRG